MSAERSRTAWRASALALTLGLFACSLAGPAPQSFTTASTKSKKSDPATMQRTSEQCRTVARDKSIKSVLGILTRLRPGAMEAEYVACMKEKGYDVKQ